MFNEKEAREAHNRYFGQSNNREPEVYDKTTHTITTSGGGKKISLMTENGNFIEKMRQISNLSGENFISFSRLRYNEYYVYYFELKDKKVSRKILNKNIVLYRNFKLLLLELQSIFFIEYLRDEDFTISEEGNLLFNNFSSLVSLRRKKKPQCKCGQELVIDLESFLQSKDEVFISQYKCTKCLEQYLILDLKEYQKNKKRSIDDE